MWSDGWLEQGGKASKAATITISLLKNFSNANYNITTTNEGTTKDYACDVHDITLSSFIIGTANTSSLTGIMWNACGY